MQSLDSGRLDEAEALGRKLLGARFSGGFEVRALVHMARGRPRDALDDLTQGTTVAPAAWILWERLAEVQRTLGDDGEARAAYERAGVELTSASPPMLRGHAPPPKTCDEALEWASGGLAKELARLVRCRDARTSPRARRFRLLVCGDWPEKWNGELEGPHGFFRHFTVVADTQEAALDLARKFVAADARGSLRIDECHDNGPAPTELVGVHDLSGNIFFPLQG